MDEVGPGSRARPLIAPVRPRIAALAEAPHRSAIALVVGMHRSGTSLCSHILSLFGVDMADEIGAGVGNEDGHWERRAIVDFHDRVLAMFNRDYFGPFHDLPLPSGWWAEPRVNEVRREIAGYLKERMGDAPFGFKDPRTLRLLPLWHHVLDDLKLAPKLVLCLRNPAQVARSLQVRDGLDPRAGEYRWLVYMVDFFRHLGDVDFCTIEYERWFDEPRVNVDKLDSFLSLGGSRRQPDRAVQLFGVIDRGLRHDDAARHEAQEPLVRQFYELARVADRDEAARDHLDELVAQFSGFERLYRGFRQAFETAAPLAAELPELERQRVALAEENARLAEENRRLAAEARRAAEAEGAAEGRLAEAGRRLDEQERVASERQSALDASVADHVRRLADRDRIATEREAESARVLAEQSTRLVETSREAGEIQAALTTRLAEVTQRLADHQRVAAERETAHAEAVAERERLAAERETAHAETLAERERLAAERETARAEALAAREVAQAEALAAREAAQAEALAARETTHARALAEREAAYAAALAERDAHQREAARTAAEAQNALTGKITDYAERLREQEASHATALVALNARLTRNAHRADETRKALEDKLVETAERLARHRALAADREVPLSGRAEELAAVITEIETAFARRSGPAAAFTALFGLRRRRFDRATRKAGRALGKRDWTGAVRHSRRALHLFPGSAPSWAQLGHALARRQDYDNAAAAYRRSIALDNRVAETHFRLAEVLSRQGRWRDAIDAYEAGLGLDPADATAKRDADALYPRLVEEGDRARDARDWANAARFYWRALDRIPDLMPIWVQLGHALKEHGDYPGAEAAYRRALALEPGAADSHLQLGHLMKLQGRRREAAQAYATAARLDPNLLPAQESLHAVLGHARGEIDRLLAEEPDDPATMPAPIAAARPPELGDRHLTAALARQPGRYDVIWLGVIDWHYRIQRPQHLARQLAESGTRVFYVSVTFDGADQPNRFRIIDSPHPGMFEVRLRVTADPTARIYEGLAAAVVAELNAALDELAATLSLKSPVVVADHPAWGPVACAVPGATVVYDCLDLATGFPNPAPTLAAAEEWMIEHADIVAAASTPLAGHVAKRRDSILIRNAAEVGFFAGAASPVATKPRPVVGYIGAIAEWFEIGWIESCARARPEWEFRLVGRTHGCDVTKVEALPNVRLLGERPYAELPGLMREFDVAVIPFKMLDLIECTNPVKLYEYMAAGKPVVSAPLPEVIDATDLAYIAKDADEFEARIATALAEDTDEARARRQAWARGHDWSVRGRELMTAIDAALPSVSVVVLSYNNWELTAACLDSIRRESDYPNLEIIVVDNASTDETPARLAALAKEDSRIEVILNDTNLGFAAGNNVGIGAARGDYVILLNNDTYVTRGWVRDLIRPMQRDPRVAMTGPLTNNIGNEQKIRIAYRSMGEMGEASRAFARARLRQRYEVANLAFFCVALRRQVIDELGPLDEVYGLGFFEDDDYCQRVKRAGYRMVIADDAFVHHHLSAAFDTLGVRAQEQMAKNRAIFEERWGPWRPHRYRDEPGFG